MSCLERYIDSCFQYMQNTYLTQHPSKTTLFFFFIYLQFCDLCKVEGIVGLLPLLPSGPHGAHHPLLPGHCAGEPSQPAPPWDREAHGDAIDTACGDALRNCITLATKITLTQIIYARSASFFLYYTKLRLCEYCRTKALPVVHACKLLRTCTNWHITPCLLYTCRQVSTVIDTSSTTK